MKELKDLEDADLAEEQDEDPEPPEEERSAGGHQFQDATKRLLKHGAGDGQHLHYIAQLALEDGIKTLAQFKPWLERAIVLAKRSGYMRQDDKYFPADTEAKSTANYLRYARKMRNSMERGRGHI